jgi:maleamate amidohydrolase
MQSIKRWRTSCGEESWVALEYIKQLIEAARAKGLPVIYTTGERRGSTSSRVVSATDIVFVI